MFNIDKVATQKTWDLPTDLYLLRRTFDLAYDGDRDAIDRKLLAMPNLPEDIREQILEERSGDEVKDVYAGNVSGTTTHGFGRIQREPIVQRRQRNALIRRKLRKVKKKCRGYEAKAADWDESEHPRNPHDGKFISAGMGGVPIPKGAMRLFHYTDEDAAESIAKEGLLQQYGRGDSGAGFGNEDSAGIWASTKPPELASQSGGKRVVEFYATPEQISRRADYPMDDDWERFADSYAHVLMNEDIKPDQFVGIHEPWHVAYRYMKRTDDPLTEYEFLLDEDPEDPGMKPYITAYRRLQEEQGQTKGSVKPNIRHVITAGGREHFDQPIGSIIIADTPLKNLKLVDQFKDSGGNWWTRVQSTSRSGKEWDIAEHETDGWQVYGVNPRNEEDMSHLAVTKAKTANEAMILLDNHLGSGNRHMPGDSPIEGSYGTSKAELKKPRGEDGKEHALPKSSRVKERAKRLAEGDRNGSKKPAKAKPGKSSTRRVKKPSNVEERRLKANGSGKKFPYKSSRMMTDDEKKRFKATAPAWFDIEYNDLFQPDPDKPKFSPVAGRAKCNNTKKPGEVYTVYINDPVYLSTVNGAKAAKAALFEANYGQIEKQVRKNALEDRDPAAQALFIAMMMGSRIGGGNTAGKKTYGVTTLEARHVKMLQDRVKLDFQGKDDQRNQPYNDDPDIRTLFEQLLEGQGPKDRLFSNLTGDDVNSYFRWVQREVGMSDQSLTAHNVRHRLANSIAREVIAKTDKRNWVYREKKVRGSDPPEYVREKVFWPPKSKAEYNAFRKAIAEAVSEKLYNKPATALSAYVDHQLFQHWEDSVPEAWRLPKPKAEDVEDE